MPNEQEKPKKIRHSKKKQFVKRKSKYDGYSIEELIAKARSIILDMEDIEDIEDSEERSNLELELDIVKTSLDEKLAMNEEIDFYNEEITGGFYSVVNNVKGKIHECYVNNIKCYADEARFGGIVISII